MMEAKASGKSAFRRSPTNLHDVTPLPLKSHYWIVSGLGWMRMNRAMAGVTATNSRTDITSSAMHTLERPSVVWGWS
jgi:hypothetical protein